MIHVITLPDLEYVINKLNSESNESFIQSNFRFCPWIYQRLVVKMFICGDVMFLMSNGRVLAIIWHDWWSPRLQYDCISSIQLAQQQREPLWRLKSRLVTWHRPRGKLRLVILTLLWWRRNGGLVKLFKLVNNNNNNNNRPNVLSRLHKRKKERSHQFYDIS